MSAPERRKPYPFDTFEPHWQRVWAERATFHAPNPGEAGFDPAQPKYYVLDMFPYPSGSGLHVGHPEGYTATDIIGRYKKRRGFNVLHPMGWDAFGLPAEQYAIKTGQHPRVTTEANVGRFRAQLQRIGFGYDWAREVNTTDPGYYRWTQWIFLQLYNSYFDFDLRKAQPIALLDDALSLTPQRRAEWNDNMYLLGTHDAYVGMDEESRARVRKSLLEHSRLAYVSEAPVNWCPALGTVLANEEVIDGKSEVGSHPVERRPMKQWMLRITAYAQRLIDELDGLDWPESIRLLQRNWIGRSEGAEVHFPIPPAGQSDAAEQLSADSARNWIAIGGAHITVFTTRPDTLYGATYMVLSPEHPLVATLTTPAQAKAVADYKASVAGKSDLERTDLAKEKTGVWTGAFATNPVNGERIPIWIADYVLMGYGTGAIMAVPGHDERDWEFARQFALPIRAVVSESPSLGLGGSGVCEAEPLDCFTGEGFAIHSGPLDGLPTAAAKAEITRRLEEQGLGRKTVNYKLRDWLFSRQRYWGEPFPIVWEGGKHRALTEAELPVQPPDMEDFKPTGTPEPPLSKAKEWLQYSPAATRETNTMPQWAGSCWYYLRYLDPQNAERFVGVEAEKYWMNVDLYVGGTEHAVLHLLYARFWHKVLFDLGHVSTSEPFQRLVNQGLILGPDGQKMSKRWGNVVDPLDVIAEYGADTLRCYLMFMGPLEQAKPWSMSGAEGLYRFLARVWRLVMEENQAGEWVRSAAVQEVPMNKALAKVVAQTIKKVGDDIEALAFNTALAQMMVCCNALTQANPRPITAVRALLSVLNPFAPHLAEELWSQLGGGPIVAAVREQIEPGAPILADEPWPTYDPELLIEDEVELPVQVNGKLRDKIVVPKDADTTAIEAAAQAAPNVAPHLAGKTVRKIVVVPGRLVNIVAG